MHLSTGEVYNRIIKINKIQKNESNYGFDIISKKFPIKWKLNTLDLISL